MKGKSTMNLMKMDFAKVELRVLANVAREQRRVRCRKIMILVGKIVMWVSVVWLVVFLLALVSGCGTVTQEPTQETKVTSDVNIQRWLTLAPYVRRHFDTGDKTDWDIALDLAYAEYSMK